MAERELHSRSTDSGVHKGASSEEVVVRPRGSVEQDGQTLSQIFNENVTLAAVADQELNSDVIAELDALAPYFDSQSRNVLGIANVMADLLPDVIAAGLAAKVNLPFIPELPNLIEDVKRTSESIAAVVDLSRPVHMVLLHTSGVNVPPAKWHKDIHLDEDSVRCLRALSGSGPDISLRDHFREVQGTKKPTFEVDKYASAPIGISIFDGRNDVHRTPGVESQDGEPVTRWAYILSGYLRQP